MAQTFTVSFRAGHQESVAATQLDVSDGTILLRDDNGISVAAYPKESVHGVSLDSDFVTLSAVSTIIRDAAYKIANATYTPFDTEAEAKPARDWLNRLADQYDEIGGGKA